MAAKIRKGDKVIVLTGRDKGRTGEVIKVHAEEGARARARRQHDQAPHEADARTQQGGIVTKEAPIHMSNVALVDPKTASRRASDSRFMDGRQEVRFAKKSGE